MSKIGMGELIIILIIAIIVLGPDKLPQLGRSLGKAVGSVKKYVHETTKELDEINELKDIKKDVEDIQKDLKNMGQSVEKSIKDDVSQVEKDVEAAQRDVEAAVEKPIEDAPADEAPDEGAAISQQPVQAQEKAVETPLAVEADNTTQEDSNT
jgi:sec-independent protein translocase protein TatB